MTCNITLNIQVDIDKDGFDSDTSLEEMIEVIKTEIVYDVRLILEDNFSNVEIEEK